MTLESDVKAIRSAADKLIAKSDKLTKGDSDSAISPSRGPDVAGACNRYGSGQDR